MNLDNPTLVLIRGLPGSGRSTVATALHEDICRFEADDFFMIDGEYNFDRRFLKDAHNWCRAQAAYYLFRDEDIAVSNTLSMFFEMVPYFKLADYYGANKVVIECCGDFGSTKPIPDYVTERVRNRWEEIFEPKKHDICVIKLPEHVIEDLRDAPGTLDIEDILTFAGDFSGSESSRYAAV